MNERFPEEAGEPESFHFSGEQQIIDDGVFRIELPVELILQGSDGESMIFEIDSYPFRIEWRTGVFWREELEAMGCPAGSLGRAMRLFMPDLPMIEALRVTRLANGFQFASRAWVADGECRSCCLIAEFPERETLVAASIQVFAPEGWEGDIRHVILLHLLRSALRFAECSIGEPAINSAGELRYVDRIGVQFPEELGQMGYAHCTNYEYQIAGKGVSLRYHDELGRKADLYVYGDGEELIEPGAETDQVRARMDAAVEDILSHYAPVIPETVEEGITTWGREGLPFLDRRLLVPGTEQEGGVVTAVLLTGFLGAFIKVRFTPLAGETRTHHPVFENFLQDLGDVLSR